MDVIHSDENTIQFIDEAAMSFMALMIRELNRGLAENGVEKSSQRQEICAGFLFQITYHLDAGWFIQGDKKLFPKVCLAERAEPKEGENLGELAVLHVPTDASSWHEYAHGVVSQFFEDDEEMVPGIRTGSYGNED